MANGKSIFDSDWADPNTLIADTNQSIFDLDWSIEEEEQKSIFDSDWAEDPTLELNQLNLFSQKDIDSDDNFIRNEQEELKRDPGLVRRFATNFIEGLSPLPIDLTSDIEQADTLSEQVAGVSGQVIGFGVGLFATGGVVGGLKIVGTGAKATKALAAANRGYTEVARLRKIAKGAKTSHGKASWMGRALKQEAKIDEALSAAGVIKNNTLMGRSKNYQQFITKMGSDGYGVGKFLSRVKGVKATGDEMAIRAANAIDLGLTNLAASSIMFQKTIPLRDEEGKINVAERFYRPVGDSFWMTLGGMPRVLGAGKIGSLALNSKSGMGVESAMVFSSGVGASLTGVGTSGKKGSETNLTDNLIDGAIFTAAHYIGVGADNMRVKEAIRQGVSSVMSDKKAAKQIIDAVNVDEVKLLMSTKRPEYLRNRFVGKTKKNRVVQLNAIKEKGGTHTLSYTVLSDGVDDLSGKAFTIDGTSKQDVLSKFYKEFKNVLPDSKKISRSYLKKNPFTLKTGTELQTMSPTSYKEHQKLVTSIEKLEDKLGISKKESFSLKRSGFTKSYGKTDRMTMEELTTYKNMLEPDYKKLKNIKRAKLDDVMPFQVPDNFFDSKNNFTAIRKYGFSPESNFMSFGIAGKELAKRVSDYAITKNLVRGSFEQFRRDIIRDFKSKKVFGDISGMLGDDKIALLADEVKIGKIADKSALQKRVRDFFDEQFVDLARNGGKIRVGRKKFRSVLNLYDAKGKQIKLSSKSFDNDDVLKVLQRRGSTVINKAGKKVTVDVEKSIQKSSYIENYVPRYLSEKAKRLFQADQSGFAAKLAAATRRRNKDVSSQEIEEIVGSYIAFGDSKKPLGILDTRKVDIPPYMVLEKKTGRVIQLDELPNVNKLKAGQTITDADNQKRVIGDIINIYENDFNKIVDNYSNQMANSISLFRNFDEGGASGKVARRFIGAIEIEAKGAKGAGDYTNETLKLLLGGESPTAISNVGGVLTTTISNAYLSGPSAVIKNFLTGQVQNLTSFGTKKLLKSYYAYNANKKFYKGMTTNIGAISDNVDELFISKGVLTKPFRAIERFNRRASVAITDITMRDSFETLLTNKRSSLIRNSKESKRILKDVMGLDDSQIEYMSGVLKKRRAFKDNAFDLSIANDKTFNDIYKRALFRSQASTQGVTQLPYIPPWMAKNNIKPLTLFYRTAYRVTENTYNKAVVPFVVDGNPFPLFRYATGSALTGAALYNLYYEKTLGKDLIGKDFKKVPMQIFDYAVRGEALGLFSNFFDGYGGAIDSYIPVPVEFGLEFGNFLHSLTQINDLDVMGRATIDYTKKQITLFKQVSDAYDNYNQDINKKFDDQKRLQGQFLDNYKQFRNKEQQKGFVAALKKGEIHDKQFYFKLLAESLKAGDEQYFEKDFLKTRAFLEHKLANVKSSQKESFYKREIRESVHTAMLNSMKQKLSPYPEKWDEYVRGQRFSDQYLKTLSPENKQNVKEIKAMYEKRMRLLDNIMRRNYNKYDSF